MMLVSGILPVQYFEGEGFYMRKLKDLIAIFAVIAVLLTVGGYSVYADVPYKGVSSWAVKEIDKAVEYGFITDKIMDGMNSRITREEFAELAVRLFEKYVGTQVVAGNEDYFTDTDNPEITKAYMLDIVKGTSTFRRLFSPNEPITREQAAAMLHRTIEAMKPDTDFSAEGTFLFKDKKQISNWAVEYVRFMSEKGFIQGYNGIFDPKGTCTREMAVLMITRIYEEYYSEPIEETENDSLDNLNRIVINDTEIFSDNYAILEKDGFSYIFVEAEMFRYAFKYPYAGYYTYPEVDVSLSSITVIWSDENGVLLRAEMQEGSEEALINGMNTNIGMAPYRRDGRMFIPINYFISVLGMETVGSNNDGILYVQYKDEFPADVLKGTWSDSNTDLFIGFQELTDGEIKLPSFATAYRFNEDGTYGLRMVSSSGEPSDTFIAQEGRYKIMGNTIMFYDIVETVFKGSPFTLSYEDKVLERPQYSFINNYNPPEDRIEISGFWLRRLQR